MKKQRRYGIVISYINILLSTFVNFFLTPMLISALSDEGYSIYKIMRSFAGPLTMMNLGVSTVVARNVAKYYSAEQNNIKEKENTFAIATVLSGMMAALVVALGYLIGLSIPSLYSDTISPENINIAKNMFFVFAATTAVHIFTESFRGCILGREKYVFYYGSQTLQYVFRFLLIIILLQSGCNALHVALVDLMIALILLIGYIVYTLGVLREKIKLHYLSKNELLQFTTFAAAILLQAIVNQVNNNLDIVIMGAMINEADVITMYSSALTIYSVYNMLVSVFTGVYLPQATKLVSQGATGEQLTSFVIKPGRLQAMIAVCVVCGFAVTGKNFIRIWIGDQYINAYYVALFLMIPVTIPLVESVCISILDAKLKRIYRSVTLVIMAGINMILTLVLVPLLGFWGALLGTVISLLLGHVIMMNLYYYKSLSMNVVRMFKEIFSGTLLNGLIATVITIPLSVVIRNEVSAFFVKAATFLTIYGVLTYFRGMNKEEKEMIHSIIKRKKADR